MSRLQFRDKFLLFVLVPVFLVTLSLHILEVQRSGLAQAPVFAVPSSEGVYPVVGGRRIERGRSWNDLQPGDRLIRLGERDLAGVGYMGFDAISLQVVDENLEAPLLFERDGVRQTVVLRMGTLEGFRWYRVPLVCLLVIIAIFLVLRSPRRNLTYFYFASGMIIGAIAETPFTSDNPLHSYAYQVIFNFGGSLALILLTRAAIDTPEELNEGARLSVHWCWFGGLVTLVRLNYFFGGFFPPQYTPYATLVADSLSSSVIIGIMTWNYVHAPPVGRRRISGLLVGSYLTVLALIGVVVLLPWLRTLDIAIGFSNLVPYLFVLGAFAIGGGFLISTVRFKFLEIERLITPAASYSLLLMVAVALIVALVPTMATYGAATIGVGDNLAQGVLAAAIAITVVPLQKRLRPVIDRIFFPERLTMEQDFNLLLSDFAYCGGTEDLLQLAGERLGTLLDPESCHVYRRRGDVFASEAPDEWHPLPTFHANSRLVRALESHPHPLRLDDASLTRTLPALNQEELGEIESTRASILLPIRQTRHLLAFVALGPSRSGEIYSGMVLAWLRAVGEKAADELLRMDSAHALERERERGLEMTALKEAADSANAAKSRFLAAASHDLRQPLHALGLFVEGLSGRVKDEAALEIVEKIKSSTDSLGEMFNDLLDISRLDAGVIELELRDLELAPLLEALHSEFLPSAQAKGLRLSSSMTRARLYSDPMLLRRIVQNLLANAIRYTDDGSVSLDVVAEGEGYRIVVRDTGRGIDEGRREDIFREFVRDGVVGSGDADGGLGLGLAIVKRLCTLLGHELALESELGKGSLFSVLVPAARGGQQTLAVAAATSQRALEQGSFESKWIVVVDDSPPIQQAMRDLLIGWGCRVTLANGLDDLLEQFEDLAVSGHPPDAIITDYHLQQSENGLDVVAALETRLDCKIPFVVISGDTSPDRLREFDERGCPHLSKPVMPFKLRAVLSEILRSGSRS